MFDKIVNRFIDGGIDRDFDKRYITFSSGVIFVDYGPYPIDLLLEKYGADGTSSVKYLIEFYTMKDVFGNQYLKIKINENGKLLKENKYQLTKIKKLKNQKLDEKGLELETQIEGLILAEKILETVLPRELILDIFDYFYLEKIVFRII